MPKLSKELLLALPEWARKHLLPVLLTYSSRWLLASCPSTVGIRDTPV